MKLRLRRMLAACKISMAQFAKGVMKPDGSGSYSKTAIFNLVTHGTIPKNEHDIKAFKQRVQDNIKTFDKVMGYIDSIGYDLEDVWDEVGADGVPIDKNKTFSLDPEDIGKEAEVLSEKAMRLFGLKKDPFLNDIGRQEDVFRGPETRFIFQAIKLAAMEQGLIAICGHVGAGKTTAKKWLVEELKPDESVHVVQPMLLDKSKVTEKSLADAIMEDLTGKIAVGGPEKRARQLRRVLIERQGEGDKVAIIIDEAHMLTPAAVLLLKALHEIENGYAKTIGIVLIGQMELSMDLLNVAVHPKLKPFVARCHVAEIDGLSKSLNEYISYKFKRVGVSHLKIMTEDAIEALGEKLSSKGGGHNRSFAYPLVVNNAIVKAMNETAKLGFKQVTEAIIADLRWK